jgi:hypothetical protein
LALASELLLKVLAFLAHTEWRYVYEDIHDDSVSVDFRGLLFVIEALHWSMATLRIPCRIDRRMPITHKRSCEIDLRRALGAVFVRRKRGPSSYTCIPS